MKNKGFKIGDICRLYSTPNYGYVKIINFIPPKTGINKKTYTIVKCEHTIYKNDNFGFIRYFRLCDLLKDNK
jgi:hypothetical protein